MKSISFLLEGMNLESEEVKISRAIQDSFLDIFGEEIEFTYRRGKVFVNMPAVYRSEIFLNKSAYMKRINQHLDTVGVRVAKIV